GPILTHSAPLGNCPLDSAPQASRNSSNPAPGRSCHHGCVDGDLQRRITGFWSTVASGYEAHGGNVPARGSEEYEAWARALEALLPPPPADVLDIGTGTGFVAMLAATSGHRVTAADLAGPMLEEATAEAARRGLTVRFTRDDAVAPSLPAASFDAVVSRHLI